MNDNEFRSPTPNETDYLNQKIRSRRRTNRWGLALTVPLTIILGFLTLWCFTQYFLGVLFIAVAFFSLLRRHPFLVLSRFVQQPG